MYPIRPAQEKDFRAICEFDHLAKESWRRQFIEDSIRGQRAYVACSGNIVIGYTVLEYSFYGQGFVAMLYIHPDFRRRGIGQSLLEHMAACCNSEKLFTSTNASNRPMQGLLTKLGFVPSGIITNLDPGDPEVVYCLFLVSHLEPDGI